MRTATVRRELWRNWFILVWLALLSTTGGVQAQAPAIGTHPQSQAVAAGSNATLSVTASGLQLSYQWWFNGTNILADATNSTLVLAQPFPINGGGYSVVVSNASGAVTSQVAQLTVNWQTSFTNRTPAVLDVSHTSYFGGSALDYNADGRNDLFIPQRTSAGGNNVLYRTHKSAA